MNLRLLRTTAFRMALAYACVFSLLSAVGLGFIYWYTANHIDAQIDARLRLETDVLLNKYRSRGIPTLVDTVKRLSRNDGQQLFFYRIWDPSTNRLAGYLPTWPDALGAQQTYATLRLSDLFQISPTGKDDRVRVLTTTLSGGQRLLVGYDLNAEEQLLEHTLIIVLVVIAVIFLLSLLGSAFMGYGTLRRIDAVSATAGEIMGGDLSRRLPVGDSDNEFDQLSRKLNIMLARIEQLMTGMRQVTDSVAHDLRRPLTRLRSRLEITLLEARSEAEYREVLERSIADADELLKTFNALLSIAQVEAGAKRNDSSDVNLATLAEDLAELYGPVAEEKGVGFFWSAASDIHIQGNRQLLAQAVGNLLDNAVKYTPSGGRVELTVSRRAGNPIISVADSGPGVPEQERERVLQRFVRLDDARSTPGNGLGLSLVHAVAKLHGARLLLGDNQPGLRATLQFSGTNIRSR